jgi:2-polyprenyl-3-methyl-5-hydroxy-6-metoxy-1,4-benzoquinol methylase
VLDVSCGIGTQTLGLAALGHHVTASDLSAQEIKRARQEAGARGLDVAFSVADMREAHAHHGGGFDIVMSCDNSMPHLQTDDDLLAAFRQMAACLRPGGGCVRFWLKLGFISFGGPAGQIAIMHHRAGRAPPLDLARSASCTR